MKASGQPGVVITGIGVVSPFGVGRERFWQHISHGCSGVRRITQFDVSGYPCQVAASVPPVSIADAAPLDGDETQDGRADPKRYSRAALFGVIAAGGTAGALAGPLFTDLAVRTIGNSGVLFLGATLFALAIVCQRALLALWTGGRGPAGDDAAPGGHLPLGAAWSSQKRVVTANRIARGEPGVMLVLLCALGW